MADEAQAPKPDDQYELGNTEYTIETPDKPVSKSSEVSNDTSSNIIDIGERPRDDKGRFLPSTQVTAAATAPPEPPKQERPEQYLVDAARDFGYTDEEIAAMPVHLLRKTLWQARERMMQVRQNMARQRTLQDGQVRNPEPEPVRDDLDFEVNEEELHPAIAKGLSALRNTVKSQRDENRALQQEVKALRTRDEQREMNRAAAIYDAAFTALGSEFEPIIGKGAGRDLDSKSAEYKRRIAILTEAQADPRVLTSGQIKAKVKAAADLLYPRPATGKAKDDAYAEVPNGAPRISPKEWNEAALARPTARKVDDEPPGDAKAVRNLTQKLNQGDVIPDSEELDGFFG